MKKIDRRSFIKTSFFAGTAATFISPLGTFTFSGKLDNAFPSVAVTTGDNRADLVFRALKPYAKQIRQAIGNRRVILKPNMVATDVPLCATHAETLEGILEFLKSIGKLNNDVTVAESAGNGPAMEGYDNYGYLPLAGRYPVKFADLDTENSEILYVFDEKDFRPHAVRFSKLLLSPDSYVVSVARMKTHNRAVATLSLKNIIFGAPVKDIGFRLRPDSKPGTRSDKPTVHGSGIRGINYNLYSLASRLHPHLAVIDGFEGMEGNGPRLGTPVDHRVCIASTDWLAADRVGVELMGIEMAKVGWLTYCAGKGFGETDLNKIEIIGERISDHIKRYKLHENIDEQLIWMKPVG